MVLISGVFNLVQYALSDLAIYTFSKNFFWVNILLIALTAATLSLPIYIKRRMNEE